MSRRKSNASNLSESAVALIKELHGKGEDTAEIRRKVSFRIGQSVDEDAIKAVLESEEDAEESAD